MHSVQIAIITSFISLYDLNYLCAMNCTLTILNNQFQEIVNSVFNNNIIIIIISWVEIAFILF